MSAISCDAGCAKERAFVLELDVLVESVVHLVLELCEQRLWVLREQRERELVDVGVPRDFRAERLFKAGYLNSSAARLSAEARMGNVRSAQTMFVAARCDMTSAGCRRSSSMRAGLETSTTHLCPKPTLKAPPLYLADG